MYECVNERIREGEEKELLLLTFFTLTCYFIIKET